MTMSLIDFTMSPELIKAWIKKVRPFLRCEDSAKLEFEKTVKEIHQKLMKRDGIDHDSDEGAATNTGRIMPFEFLYLLCNARPRMENMEKLTVYKTGVVKEKLSEFFEGEERRLDLEQIYPFDIPINSKRFNPREQ